MYKNIVIASHAFVKNDSFNVRSGPVGPLLDYFSSRAENIFLIGQPPPYADGSLAPFLFVYHKGFLKEKKVFKNLSFLYDIVPQKRKNRTYFRLKLRDFFCVLRISFFIRKKFLKSDSVDIFFGVESVNALAGKLTKKILNIKKNVYYIFDWSIKWFPNPFLNQLYLFFDRAACFCCDYVWNITSAIEEARRDILRYRDSHMGKQLTVPYGMPFRGSLVRDELKGAKDSIVYCGYLSQENGASLLVDIALALKRLNLRFKLIVIGSGDLFETIQKEKKEKKADNLLLKGHMDQEADMDAVLTNCHVAIAPYFHERSSKKRFGDVIKIRHYFACGLPVISTDVVPAAKEITLEGLGEICAFCAQDFARACYNLLNDGQRYQQVRSRVIEKAKNHNWEHIYTRALSEMQK